MSVTVTESEWDSDEREKMIALAELERHVHGRCGRPLVDVFDPDSDSDPETGRPERYVAATTPLVCHYCAAQEDATRAYMEEWGKKTTHPGALVFPVYDRGRDR